MDTGNFDVKIDELTSSKKVLTGQLESLVTEYITACVEFLTTEFTERVEHAVKNRPHITKALGVDGLRGMKIELNDLIANIPDITSKHLTNDALWRHRKPVPTKLGYEFFLGAGDVPKKELNRIMGHVGAILVKHGYAEVGYHAEWVQGSGDIPEYGFALVSNSDGLSKILGQYEGVLKSFGQNEEALRAVLRAKEEAIAQDLWESV